MCLLYPYHVPGLCVTLCLPPQIDLQLNNEQGGDISGYITNGEWDLIGEPRLAFERTLLTITRCKGIAPFLSIVP